jgi:hypothetical protein
MTITYSIWQGPLMKGVNLKASKAEEITDAIKELNSLGDKLKFEAFISKIEA